MLESTWEAPGPTDSVVPSAAANSPRRPGPVVGNGSGVFQPTATGKYHSSTVDSLPESPSHSSVISCEPSTSADHSAPSKNNVIRTPDETAAAEPGRMLESTWEAPGPTDPVEPSTAANSPRRPGPVVGTGSGVFQPTATGKYHSSTVDSLPESSSHSSDFNLRIYYQNVRGLRTKIDDFFLAVGDSEYDVIVLTESWLNNQILSTQLFGGTFTVYRNDRNPTNSAKSTGGGVLIAVSNRFDSCLEPTPVCNTLEQLWVRLTVQSKLICVGVLYLPPILCTEVKNIENHIDSIGSILSRIDTYDSFIQFGDYNQPHLKWISSDNGGLEVDPLRSRYSLASSCLVDGFNLHGLTQVNPTVNFQARCLDLVLVNDAVLPRCTVSEAVEPLVTMDPAHPALELSVDVPSPSIVPEQPAELPSYNFRKANYADLQEALDRTDWEFLESAHDIDAAVDTFQSVVSRIISESVPLKRPPQKPPWSNDTLRRLKRQKASALQKFCNHRSPFYQSQFFHASRRYRSYNRRRYNRYVIRVQADLRRNPKNFWSFVNSKRKENGLPSSMFLNDNMARTPQDKCTLFANHFKQAFNDRTATMEQVGHAIRNTPSNVFDCSLAQVTQQQVADAIRKLKFSYAVGPDGIPSAVLKRCSLALLLPLTRLFNISLRESSFPTSWKSSLMFPVHKKGDKGNIKNYRGITSLCACSKVFEIIVNDTLITNCRTYISTDQHGFVPKRSVSTNLVQFVSHCLEHMDAGAQIDAVYTDLKAAFDRVDHAILLKRLEILGVSPSLVAWFKSYLTSRVLRVRIGSFESDAFSNLSGVPQGSNLGPLLFILFINELASLLRRGCRSLYADDVKIFMVIRSVVDCSKLQRLINIFNEWCVRNFLTVSIEKCSVISFHRKLKPVMFDYTLSDTVLERVDHIRDLGVQLDRELTFRSQFHDIASRANRQLGFIFRIADNFRDLACLRSLYCSLVRSILEFSAVVWCPYQTTWIERIESVQRKFTRIALRRVRSPVGWDSYENRCRFLNLETLEQRRRVMQTLFIAKVLTGENDAPSILAQVNFYAPVRQLRHRAFLHLVQRNTEYGQHAPIRFMCSRFNEVSDLFDFNLSTTVFQNRLRTFLSFQP